METAFLEPPRHHTSIKEKAKGSQPCANPRETLIGKLVAKCPPQVEGGIRVLRRRLSLPKGIAVGRVPATHRVPLDVRLLKNGSLKIALHLYLCVGAQIKTAYGKNWSFPREKRRLVP